MILRVPVVTRKPRTLRPIGFLYLLVCLQGTGWGADLDIGETLRRAEKASPDLKAAQAREAEVRESIRIVKSGYYPTVEAEAIDGWGYAGSNGALGLAGLMGSPFRKGPAAGLVSRLDVWDAPRRYRLEAAEERLKVSQEEVRIVRFRVDQAALQIYFEGARDRGGWEAWREVSREIWKVAREVKRLVKTGQHSPVEQYLIEDQVTEALMSQAVDEKKYRIALRRLALFIGADERSISCPLPASLLEKGLSTLQPGSESPLVSQASAAAAAARTDVLERRSQNYPTVSALASAGTMDESIAVPLRNYSGGVGVVLPLFEGFRIAGEARQAESVSARKDEDLLSARLDVDEQNARYDEAIFSSKVRLDYLGQELDTAHKALALASHRYFSFIGPLVEVREALRNLARIELAINDAKTDLLLASGSKTLLNGGTVSGER